MRFNKNSIILLLVIAVIIALFVAIWMPFKTRISNLDFHISDSNQNYHYEVNEKLIFFIGDSLSYTNRDMVWHMGNGDTLNGLKNINYTYRENGKYMITLEVDNKYKISKYIEVISRPVNKLMDSIPKIYGMDTGYVGEELVFSSYGPAISSWFWEFGETGAVDAYEGQAVYMYKKPGIYNVKLKTNTSKYPVNHFITILPLFEALEEKESDSLSIAQNDIKKRLQTIADASIKERDKYYRSLNHIERKYTCSKADQVVIVVNGTKYNDLYSYCQGLHYLEGRGTKTVVINEVVIDTFNCLKKIEVTQSIIDK